MLKAMNRSHSVDILSAHPRPRPRRPARHRRLGRFHRRLPRRDRRRLRGDAEARRGGGLCPGFLVQIFAPARHARRDDGGSGPARGDGRAPAAPPGPAQRASSWPSTGRASAGAPQVLLERRGTQARPAGRQVALAAIGPSRDRGGDRRAGRGRAVRAGPNSLHGIEPSRLATAETSTPTRSRLAPAAPAYSTPAKGAHGRSIPRRRHNGARPRKPPKPPRARAPGSRSSSSSRICSGRCSASSTATWSRSRTGSASISPRAATKVQIEGEPEAARPRPRGAARPLQPARRGPGHRRRARSNAIIAMSGQPTLDGIIAERGDRAAQGDDPHPQEDDRPALQDAGRLHGGAGPRRHDLRARARRAPARPISRSPRRCSS